MESISRSSSYLKKQPHAFDFGGAGFVVLEQFLNEHEVATIRSRVDSLLALPLESACARPNNTLAPLRWNEMIVQLLLTSERRMGILAQAVRGRDLKWVSGYLSIKEPHTPALWWHQDWWCWDHAVTYRRAAPQIAVLCYLTDTRVENGALRVLPGSHLKSVPIHAALPEAHGKTAEDLGMEHIAMRDLPDQVTLCLDAGDAVAIDYRLLHGTHGNASGSRRDCILLSFTPSWRQLPEDIRAHLIDHPCQPSQHEMSQTRAIAKMLPSFNGARRSLPLNRNAPSRFEVGD